jgi:uncharacterized protein (DUF433 family)
MTDEQVERLKGFASQMGKSLSETGALFIEEAMREEEFEWIEFQDTVVGRMAYMRGSRIAVWHVIMIAQSHDMDAERVACYFNRPIDWAAAALRYYQRYQAEIDERLEYNRSMTYEKLKEILPNIERFEVPQSVLRGEAET